MTDRPDVTVHRDRHGLAQMTHGINFAAPKPPRDTRWRWAIGLLVAVLLFGLAALLVVSRDGGEPGAVPPVTTALEKTFELQSAGRLDDAIIVYLAVIEDDPDSIVAHFNLGVIADAQSRSADAMASYERVIEIEPDHVLALFNLAVDTRATGDAVGAERLYRRAIAADPDHAPSLLNLGVQLLETGELEEGSELIDRAIAIDPMIGRDSNR